MCLMPVVIDMSSITLMFIAAKEILRLHVKVPEKKEHLISLDI